MEVGQDRGRGELVFQELESLPAFVPSEEFMVLPSERNNGCNKIAVSLDKLSVKVRKAQESPDVMELFWGHPLDNGFDLLGIHGYSILGEN